MTWYLLLSLVFVVIMFLFFGANVIEHRYNVAERKRLAAEAEDAHKKLMLTMPTVDQLKDLLEEQENEHKKATWERIATHFRGANHPYQNIYSEWGDRYPANKYIDALKMDFESMGYEVIKKKKVIILPANYALSTGVSTKSTKKTIEYRIVQMKGTK